VDNKEDAMGERGISEIADRSSPHGVEIDGIGYVPDPPKWVVDAMENQQKQPGANVIKLRDGKLGELAT
jgi:hypothetical protein